ncbi:unnamed protein product [Ceratitis capitata]|uniref:(Mediterranean fruit fly) hypothetical protein n=1 Tax=Ceratitis capitata TaxID=7213 RepID=A0A811USG4_CERCA|nr:unnamed protein product [Ceratitis capitata]
MARFGVMLKRAEQQAHRYPQPCRLCKGKHPIRLCPHIGQNNVRAQEDAADARASTTRRYTFRPTIQLTPGLSDPYWLMKDADKMERNHGLSAATRRRGAEPRTVPPHPTQDAKRSLQRFRQLSRTFPNQNHSLTPVSLQPVTARASTEMVQLEVGGRLHLVRTIINVCAPTSIIAWELAEELHLQIARYTHAESTALTPA